MGIVNFTKVFMVFLISLMFMMYPAYAQEGSPENVCIVYFTNVDCANCQVTDDFIFNVIEPEYNVNFIVIEYDIYNPQENGPVADEYVNNYNLPNRIPLVLIGPDYFFVGMDDIRVGLGDAVEYLVTQEGNNCPMADGTTKPWEDIVVEELPGSPQVTEVPSDGVPGEMPPEDTEQKEDVDRGEDETETFIPDIGGAIQSMIKDVVESEHFYDWLIVTAAFIILIFGVSLLFVRKKVR